MSGFVSDLRMTMLCSSDGVPLKSIMGNQLYILDAPLFFYSDILGAEIYVPVNFITDMASIPRLPFVYMALNGASDMPAVLHDSLYSAGIFPRKFADDLFREACLSIGLPVWQVQLLYMGVRLGGASRYMVT